MKKWLLSKLSMKRRHCMFVDRVSGKEVFNYIDCYGQEWMAEWSHWFFRVKIGATHDQ
jgi:hypothetical protein